MINNTIYDSHKSLVHKIVKEMGGDDSKAVELVKKYLDKLDIKAKKDPNKPKRPKSAFLLYCDDERPKLIKKKKVSLKKDKNLV